MRQVLKLECCHVVRPLPRWHNGCPCEGTLGRGVLAGPWTDDHPAESRVVLPCLDSPSDARLTQREGDRARAP